MNLVQQLTQAVQQLTGQPVEGEEPQAADGGAQKPQGTGGRNDMDRKGRDAQKQNMTSYGQRLAERAGPNMNLNSNGATPGG